MRRIIAPALVAIVTAAVNTGVGSSLPAAAAGETSGLQETPPFFAPQFHFSYRGKDVDDTDRPECRSRAEAEAYFAALRKGAPERGIPPETIVTREDLDAGRFISAAWSEKGVLPFEGSYADVDLVIVRTRPDIPGFAKVQFGSHKRGFICNFAHAVIITAERMRQGLLGIPPARPWRKGDPYPGMSEDERNAFKMLYGLRNQMERGNAEEREEALRGFEQLLQTPRSRLDKPFPSDLPPIVVPKPRPQFEPTPKDVERDMGVRPTCREDPYFPNCIPAR